MILGIIKNLDNFWLNVVYKSRTEFLSGTFLKITYLGSTFFVVLVSVITICALILYKKKYTALYFAGSLFVTDLFVYIVKYLVDRPRPDSPIALYLESTPSFPSGHSAMSFALYAFIALLCFLYFEKVYKKIVVLAVSILLIILIGFSRIYLGVHYPSDVLGGYLIALSIFLFTSFRVYYLKENKL